MTPENRNIPEWAHRERESDLNWIKENLDVFWTAASAVSEEVGPGAIFVDTTIEPMPGAGNPFAYLSRDQVDEFGNEDTKRMVTEYDPTRELILVLLKPGDRTSTYRLQLVPSSHQESLPGDRMPSHLCQFSGQQAAAIQEALEPLLKAPRNLRSSSAGIKRRGSGRADSRPLSCRQRSGRPLSELDSVHPLLAQGRPVAL